VLLTLFSANSAAVLGVLCGQKLLTAKAAENAEKRPLSSRRKAGVFGLEPIQVLR